MEKFKVSGKSNARLLAGAIAGSLKEHDRIEIIGIGAAAVNNAIKAVAVARGFVAPHGIDLICIPGFEDVVTDDVERTAVKLIVEKR